MSLGLRFETADRRTARTGHRRVHPPRRRNAHGDGPGRLPDRGAARRARGRRPERLRPSHTHHWRPRARL